MHQKGCLRVVVTVHLLAQNEQIVGRRGNTVVCGMRVVMTV
jgi:hypothetical protein